MQKFKLVSPFSPMGDQEEAIKQLVAGIKEGKKEQVLLGGTGTGKTFTVSNVIAAEIGRASCRERVSSPV